VESKNYLGIYLSKTTATAVCLGPQADAGAVLGCFTVSTEGREQATLHTLANLVAQGCAERKLQFSEVAVALDCAMFMQHSVHSEFSDPGRVAATMRFDAEEALATDIADVAVTFQITSGGDGGSELTVFTAQRKALSDVLGAMQSNNIDPVSIEPDVSCLSRFICRKMSSPEMSNSVFVLLSRSRGYLIIPPPSGQTGPQKASVMRTFLLGAAQHKNEMVAREVLVTTALAEDGPSINSLKIFDSGGSIDCRQLGTRVGIEASAVDLAGTAAIDAQDQAGCPEPVDFAIAYGAALAHLEKAHRVNFRDDFMPYQGKKLRLQKTLKFASISVSALLIAVGLYFQTQLWKVNSDRGKLHDRLAKDFSAVMLGEKLPDKTSISKRLANELRRVRAAKVGGEDPTGEESISSKLTLVLDSFNKCAAETNLEIESISISAKSISVDGSTSSRTNTLKLFEAVGKGGLEIEQQRLTSKGARDDFSITVKPKSQARAGL
jgi:hypothetical protein